MRVFLVCEALWMSVEDDPWLYLTIYCTLFAVEFLDKKFMGHCTCWSWGQISKHAATLACIRKSLWVFYLHVRYWASIHNRKKPEGIITFIVRMFQSCVNVASYTFITWHHDFNIKCWKKKRKSKIVDFSWNKRSVTFGLLFQFNNFTNVTMMR
jgi:hypothetical protein